MSQSAALLLDSHILLWWLADDRRLAEPARAAIADAANTVFVSAASVWEISVKRALGKLRAPGSLVDAIAACRFEPLPITLAQGELAGALPRYHDDPFDRMLVAQAMLERLTLVTVDPRLAQYEVEVLT